MTQLAVRQAVLEDVTGIQQVARVTWKATYQDLLPEAGIEEFLQAAYSEKNLERAIILSAEDPARRLFLVATDADQVVGFAQTRQVEPGRYELTRIYTLPTYQGQGVGYRLLQHTLQTFPDLRELYAWVEADNQTGRSFYEKQGFVVTGQKHETYFEQPVPLLEYTLEVTLNI